MRAYAPEVASSSGRIENGQFQLLVRANDKYLYNYIEFQFLHYCHNLVPYSSAGEGKSSLVFLHWIQHPQFHSQLPVWVRDDWIGEIC